MIEDTLQKYAVSVMFFFHWTALLPAYTRFWGPYAGVILMQLTIKNKSGRHKESAAAKLGSNKWTNIMQFIQEKNREAG